MMSEEIKIKAAELKGNEKTKRCMLLTIEFEGVLYSGCLPEFKRVNE